MTLQNPPMPVELTPREQAILEVRRIRQALRTQPRDTQLLMVVTPAEKQLIWSLLSRQEQSRTTLLLSFPHVNPALVSTQICKLAA